MPLSPEQLDKIWKWKQAANSLALFKETERVLRDELVKELFNASKDVESETIPLVNGYQLKATKKLDYSLSNKNGEVIALVAELPDDFAATLVKWKPELSVSTYTKASPDIQAMFDGILTIKPGAPSLEFIEPKEGKS